MGRAKLPRKSTNIDMTAMCDVAFLLLSFFILTTKFKPAEAIAVTTPKSVAAKVAPTKDIVEIIIDKDGKVFLSMDDESIKETIANSLNSTRNLG
jgi:biopolymer transport protein ExbD